MRKASFQVDLSLEHLICRIEEMFSRPRGPPRWFYEPTRPQCTHCPFSFPASGVSSGQAETSFLHPDIWCWAKKVRMKMKIKFSIIFNIEVYNFCPLSRSNVHNDPAKEVCTFLLPLKLSNMLSTHPRAISFDPRIRYSILFDTVKGWRSRVLMDTRYNIFSPASNPFPNTKKHTQKNIKQTSKLVDTLQMK